MRYITLDQLSGHINKKALALLTDSQGAEPDATVLELINDDATAEIDDFLRGIYPLPLAEPTPRTIKTITADIMIYRLNARRDAKNIAESVLKLYQTAIARLRDIQARKMVLDVAPPPGETATTPGTGTVKRSGPTAKYRPHFTNFDQD